MKKTTRFVVWICKKFTREEIEQIIQGLLDILANRNLMLSLKMILKRNTPIIAISLLIQTHHLKLPLNKLQS